MRSVVAGGHGSVGALFCGLLGRLGPTTSVDLAAPGGERGSPAGIAANILSPDRTTTDLLGRADMVVLAVPERVMAHALGPVTAAMAPGALLVHTASVQTAMSAAMRREAVRHRLQACGVDPMFAPGLGFAGRPVALIPIRPGPLVDALAQAMAGADARVVRLTAGEHDRLTAGIQVAVHASMLAFGLSLSRSGSDIGAYLDLATPPFRTVLALWARMCAGSPEVYREIQAVHPLGEPARARLAECLAELSVLSSDPGRFAATVAAMSQWLGPWREVLAAECARWFATSPAGPARDVPGGP